MSLQNFRSSKLLLLPFGHSLASFTSLLSIKSYLLFSFNYSLVIRRPHHYQCILIVRSYRPTYRCIQCNLFYANMLTIFRKYSYCLILSRCKVMVFIIHLIRDLHYVLFRPSRRKGQVFQLFFDSLFNIYIEPHLLNVLFLCINIFESGRRGIDYTPYERPF